jgi:hypothetical protein
MQFLSEQDLAHRTENELSALFNLCNLKVATTKPFSREWKTAQSNVENILRVRRQRLQQFKPRGP